MSLPLAVAGFWNLLPCDSCRNIASQTIARLKDVARRISNYLEAEQVSKERSASLDLLLRFQRLLVSKLYLGASGTESVNGYSQSLLQMFVQMPQRVEAGSE